MKIEHLPNGSSDCPLIRLYDFDTSEAKQFQDVVVDLAEGKTSSVALEELQFIESVKNCSLAFVVGETDEGVVQLGNMEFQCSLTSAGWKQVANLVDSFLSNLSGFQWLVEPSPIELLLSSNGSW
jgi:hypothetical protein